MSWVDRIIGKSYAYKSLLHSAIRIQEDYQNASQKRVELQARLDLVEQVNSELRENVNVLAVQCVRLAKIAKKKGKNKETK